MDKDIKEVVFLYEEAFNLYENGKCNDALMLAKRSYVNLQKICGNKALNTNIHICSYSLLGAIYDKLLAFDKALPFHKKALETAKKVYGEEHEEIAHMMNNLGLLYANLGKFDDSLLLLEGALAMDERLLANESRKELLQDSSNETLKLSKELSIVPSRGLHMTLSTSSNASSQKSSKESLKIPSEKISHKAMILHNLAVCYRLKGDYEQALKFGHLSLNLKEERDGKCSIDVALGYHELGYLYKVMKKYEESVVFYKACLHIKYQIFGQIHASTAKTLNNLASVYFEMDDYPQALEIMLAAHSAYRLTIGAEDPLTLTVEGACDYLQSIIDQKKSNVEKI
jgi:tetratricopeptide (TPR) repeat protein